MASPQVSDWRAAADDEMASLLKAQVFHYVPRSSLPPQSKVVSCKWVFKVKRHADGSIEQYKARLCACGFDQVAGVDYEETFAPVAKFQSIRVILALAAHHDLELHQMDVKTAFLYGKLEEDVYLDQPEGYDTKPGMVWKLDKALYGLKQAPRAWYQELHSTLTSLGFTRTYSDYSVYVRGQGSSYIVVGVYVDDLTIAARQLSVMDEFKTQMSKRYEMKDLGELHFILGLQVKRDRSARTLHLSQQHYIETILERFNVSDLRPTKSPLPSNTLLSPRTPDDPPCDRNRYLEALGSLMYAMLGTRGDLSFSIGLLSRFANDPSEIHWRALLHSLRYLHHTRHLGITFAYHPDGTGLEGFADADHGTSDISTRRSVSGYVFRLCGGAVSWQSKRQPCTALATGDAEYMALSHAAKELVWLRQLLWEIGFPVSGPTPLHGDNKAALTIAQNPVAHTRCKQIDIRFHHLHDLVSQHHLRLAYLPTHQMVADGLTKPLAPGRMNSFLKLFGIVEPSN